MTTIKHAGVPVAVVPASSTRDMDEEIAYFRADGVTEESDIFNKVCAAAPSEPSADLAKLLGAAQWVCAASHHSSEGPASRSALRAALAKWEVSND